MRPSILAVLVMARAALAQPSASRDEAVRRFDTQDYAGAVVAFKRCYQLDQDPACLYGLGQSYRALGDCANAVAAYQAYLRTSPPLDKRQKATLNIEACEPQPPPPPPPPRPKSPPVTVTSPWYRDRLGGALALGAVTGVAAGTTMIVLGDRARSAAELEGRGSGSLQLFEHDLDRAHRDQLAGTIALSAGGAFAVGAILRYVLRDPTITFTASTSGSSGSSSRWITFESRF